MAKIVKIDVQQKVMQVNAEKIVATFDKKVIVITNGIQHIQTKLGVIAFIKSNDTKALIPNPKIGITNPAPPFSPTCIYKK